MEPMLNETQRKWVTVSTTTTVTAEEAGERVNAPPRGAGSRSLEPEEHMTAVPEIIEVPSYEHLVLLDSSMEYDRLSLITFLFRGHARADWRPAPSLLRRLAFCGLSAAEALARSARLEFSRQAHLHLPISAELRRFGHLFIDTTRLPIEVDMTYAPVSKVSLTSTILGDTPSNEPHAAHGRGR